LNEAINIFAGFNSGFKSPARIPGAAYSSGLDPEKVLSYEVGIRGLPISWLSYNIAGFLNQYKDKWVKTGIEPTDPYTNSGETEAQGIELSVGLDFDSGFFADISYTYQESKYDDFREAGVSYDDNWLPNVPKQMLGLLAGYHHTSLGQITLTADYVGERYFNKENTLKGDDYWILGGSYKKSFDQWKPGVSIFLTAENITDEEAVVFGSGTPGSESLRPVYGRRIFGGIELML
jgi:iron complex outermembrane receptor protein